MLDMLIGWYDAIYGTQLLASAKDILTGTGLSGAETFMRTGYELLVGLSAVLVSLYFLLDLIEEMQRSQHITIELLFKSLVKVVIAVMLISNGYELFSTLRQLGDQLVTSLIAIGGINDITRESPIITDSNIFELIALAIKLFLPFILSKILQLGINVTCYARMIEIAGRTVFAPLAIANVFHDGLRSPGVRYIKKYIGVCLQAAMIIVILAFISVISNNALNGIDGDNFIWATLAINYAGLMAILKSQQIANDVAGV